MPAQPRPANVLTLREALPIAEAAGYALGSFSPRYLALLRPTLEAAVVDDKLRNFLGSAGQADAAAWRAARADVGLG